MLRVIILLEGKPLPKFQTGYFPTIVPFFYLNPSSHQPCPVSLTSTAVKHSHSMMAPLPCFTVGTCEDELYIVYFKKDVFSHVSSMNDRCRFIS